MKIIEIRMTPSKELQVYLENDQSAFIKLENINDIEDLIQKLYFFIKVLSDLDIQHDLKKRINIEVV